MADYHITCSIVEPSKDRSKIEHKHVAKVGYLENGSMVIKTRVEMVALLDAGNTAYTTTPDGRQRTPVRVITCHCGLRVLRTNADTTQWDNLYNLPDC